MRKVKKTRKKVVKKNIVRKRVQKKSVKRNSSRKNISKRDVKRKIGKKNSSNNLVKDINKKLQTKKIHAEVHKSKPDLKGQKVLESYDVKLSDMDYKITITFGPSITKRYVVSLPELGIATKALLEEVKADLVSKVNISSSEILDPKEINHIKKKFKEQANILLEKRLINLNKNTERLLVSLLIQDMLGLGDIEYLLADEMIEEIVIMSANENTRIYHRKHGWLETNIKPRSESEIQNFSNIIARRVGRQITTLSPLLDAHLLTGDRANAVLFPISSKGHTVTIRKFSRDPYTVTDFIKNGTCSSEVFALIWLAIQYEMSILVSGGTGSGKTTFLNVCMPFIPPNHRIVSIEDTRELQLPEFLFWCPLTTRESNPEGKGSVDMLDLLVNSLRMRPDRIILGEMRKKDQAEVLFEAMHTGHSVYSTVHADSSAETIRRLVNPPIEVPPNLLSGVNLNVVMFRDRRSGLRRASQISEFVDAEGELVSVKPNILYRWRQDIDKQVLHNKPLKLFEDLNKFTGMSLTQIGKDLGERKKILDWMVKKNIRTVKEVGAIMRDYYLDPKSVMKEIK
jgi:archaeal flagellar protein FlaI